MDRHRVPLPADELRRVRGTAPAAGAGGVHPPGFPDYFREEPSWAKLPGVGLILAPVTARLHEWAYASEPLTAHRRLFTSKECEEAATLAMLSPLSREASGGMLFTRATHCEKPLEYARRRG